MLYLPLVWLGTIQKSFFDFAFFQKWSNLFRPKLYSTGPLWYTSYDTLISL